MKNFILMWNKINPLMLASISYAAGAFRNSTQGCIFCLPGTKRMPCAVGASRKKLAASRSVVRGVGNFSSCRKRTAKVQRDLLRRRRNDGVVWKIPSHTAGDFEWRVVHSDVVRVFITDLIDTTIILWNCGNNRDSSKSFFCQRTNVCFSTHSLCPDSF